MNATGGYNPAGTAGGGGGTTAVDTFAPNGYGLYDMAGNVSQWCWDWYDGAYYSYSPGIDTRGPGYSPDGLRVLRGGVWLLNANYARCANRYSFDSSPSNAYVNFGFRCVRGL